MAYRIDSLDQEIVRQLQADGRTSNVDIARSLGIAEATVRKRLDRLIKEGVISVSAFVDGKRVGLEAHTILFLKAAVSQVDRVGRALAELPAIRCVHLITGDYNLMAEAIVSDNAALTRFLTEKLTAIPGVLSVSTSQVLDTFKTPQDWLIPEADLPRVLVVDDDPDFVEIVRHVLRSERMDVVSAGTAEEALARAKAMMPDLVIMDVMMRGILDGVAATRNLRMDTDLAHVPILMITSMPSSEHASLFPVGEEVPVDQLLTKPVSPEALVSEVKRLLQPR